MRLIVAIGAALTSGAAGFFLFDVFAGQAAALVVGIAIAGMAAVVFGWALS